MNKGDWEIISKQLIEADNEIFKGIDKSKLSDYEKRKMIFSYLCDILKYDSKRLLDIILCTSGIYAGITNGWLTKEEAKKKVYQHMINTNSYDENIYKIIEYRIDNNLIEPNNPAKDLENVMKTKKCLCHSASQFYKLLLEYNGIYAACVCCDNNMPVSHQLTLVYDKEHDSYSFDDISTFTAVKYQDEANMYKYFDYDLEDAKKIGQGLKPLQDYKKQYWIILPSVFANLNAGKDDEWYLQFDLEKNGNYLLPNNIESLKKKEQIKR